MTGSSGWEGCRWACGRGSSCASWGSDPPSLQGALLTAPGPRRLGCRVKRRWGVLTSSSQELRSLCPEPPAPCEATKPRSRSISSDRRACSSWWGGEQWSGLGGQRQGQATCTTSHILGLGPPGCGAVVPGPPVGSAATCVPALQPAVSAPQSRGTSASTAPIAPAAPASAPPRLTWAVAQRNAAGGLCPCPS